MSSNVADPNIIRFHKLMPHRVREVLLVSSPYDAFILEEDGSLTERLFDEYSELSLSSAPRVTHVTTAEAALDMMDERRFDIILSMMRLADMDPEEFGRKVKEKRPGRPVVLLAFDNPDLERISNITNESAIDMVFMWRGDSKILLAIIKYIEDMQNVDYDIAVANVRVIILVEDTVRFYSTFLGNLYSELMQQSNSLCSEGVNTMNKLLHMRSRPKVLFARDYQGALALYEKYKDNVLALISDCGFNIDGVRDRTAGIQLAKIIRKEMAELPILLHSAEDDLRGEAEKLNALFLNKNSPRLHNHIHAFLENFLGFGPFIFRMPDGREVGRAHDVRELERIITDIPRESLSYHAQANHISVWLLARNEYGLARKFRPRKVTDFQDMEAVRRWVIKKLKEERRKKRRGVITEYSRLRLEPENRFLRIGKESIGGKARGIAFINSILPADKWAEKFEGLIVQVPQTIVLCTDWFDEFLSWNNLYDTAYNSTDDFSVVREFIKAELPKNISDELRFMLETLNFPLAVRSSSLLEDSQYQPFAGIYETYMLPNNNKNADVRFNELARAIKLVFASTFSQNAKAYIENTARRIEEEKMAVIIQGVVGQRHGSRYYPSFSGVAQSYNYYPIGHLSSGDGITMVALGLGRMVVSGGQSLRFSPKFPQVLPQFSSPEAILKNSQKGFWALDMESSFVDDPYLTQTTLKYYNLDAAEKDGTLKIVGSTFSPDNDRIIDSFEAKGPRVITFNNLLKYNAIPLTEALFDLMELCKMGMGSDIEIEFAVDMGDWGKTVPRGQKKISPTLNVLQLRPILSESTLENQNSLSFLDDQCVCKTEMAMGHGLMDNIKDIIYVKRQSFDPAFSKKIAAEIGQLNNECKSQGKEYILIGPGRWGSADPWLGIPVQWSQISRAKVIVEASPKGYNVDPSQGTHFFQNITSLRIGYLTIPPGAEVGESSDFVDWEYLDCLVPIDETRYLRQVRCEMSFFTYIDGRKGEGVIAKPGVSLRMDDR